MASNFRGSPRDVDVLVVVDVSLIFDRDPLSACSLTLQPLHRLKLARERLTESGERSDCASIRFGAAGDIPSHPHCGEVDRDGLSGECSLYCPASAPMRQIEGIR